jgi:hypothetical protein
MKKPFRRQKRDRRQDNKQKDDDVRSRTEGKPRRTRQEIKSKKSNDNSFPPFLGGTAQKTGQDGQESDEHATEPASRVLIGGIRSSLRGIVH